MKTWVLILNPSNGRHPIVVGGYASEIEAFDAGCVACGIGEPIDRAIAEKNLADAELLLAEHTANKYGAGADGVRIAREYVSRAKTALQYIDSPPMLYRTMGKEDFWPSRVFEKRDCSGFYRSFDVIPGSASAPIGDHQ